jgi:hypothetical protein
MGTENIEGKWRPSQPEAKRPRRFFAGATVGLVSVIDGWCAENMERVRYSEGWVPPDHTAATPLFRGRGRDATRLFGYL